MRLSQPSLSPKSLTSSPTVCSTARLSAPPQRRMETSGSNNGLPYLHPPAPRFMGSLIKRDLNDSVSKMLQEYGADKVLLSDEQVRGYVKTIQKAQATRRDIFQRHLEALAETSGDPALATPQSRKSMVEALMKRPMDLMPDYEVTSGEREILSQGVNARNEMVRKNTRFSVFVAKKYRSLTGFLSLKDLIQEANLGLMTAAERYKSNKEANFGTYAYYHIRQRILRAFENRARTIRLPINLVQALRTYRKSVEALEKQGNFRPTLAQVANKMEITEVKLKELLRVATHPMALDAPPPSYKMTREGESDPFINLLSDTSTPSPETMAYRDMIFTNVNAMMDDCLTAKERDVLRMRHGLDGGEGKSLNEIAGALNLTQERVRQIEAKALQKLRRPGNRNKYIDRDMLYPES